MEGTALTAQTIYLHKYNQVNKCLCDMYKRDSRLSKYGYGRVAV